ncbi:hypothetical protein D3W54_04590 [Komagataeibacter medellinensis]|uniref:Uncharacterized protein n=3 Tax=Komagataeibacter medellinensis TaxID=1177712 RepID=G2I1H9_KOMMN|nr:hypothetical protein D3W54_04590 [Komagataeibacter medellinensis]BAK84787.1 hypothetical protein GLX_23750 [Komagataeibacter medellinensis NBRC 3288]
MYPAQIYGHADVPGFVRRHRWFCIAMPLLLALLAAMAGYLRWSDHSDARFARHNTLMKHSQEEAAYARQLAEYDETIIRNRRVFLDITRADFTRVAPPSQMAWLVQEYRKFDVSRVKVYDGHEIRPYVPEACADPLCFIPIFVEELHDDPIHNRKYVQVGALQDMSRTLIIDTEQFWRLRKLVIRVDAILFAAYHQQIEDYEKAIQLRDSLEMLRQAAQKMH